MYDQAAVPQQTEPTGEPRNESDERNAVRLPLAGFGARAVSFVIDHLAPWLALGIALTLAAVINGALVSVVGIVGGVGVLAFSIWNSGYRQGTTGQSLGRTVASTRLVSIRTGEPVGFATALLRQLCHLVEFGIGYLWPLWDSRRQTFADKIVATVVVGETGDHAGADAAPR